MRLPASPTFFGTPQTSPQPGFVTPPTAPQPTTPPPVRQQEAMTPPNTPENQGSPTGINEINALFSQLNISNVADTDPKSDNLIKSPSAPDNQADPQEQNSLDSVSVNLFGSGAFDNLDDDEAATVDNEQNYETVIEFITHPQNQNNASGA
ncbi:MAG: hypothetical protein ACON35_01495 [Candidatus Marinamargulisbacteria bacterium]